MDTCLNTRKFWTWSVSCETFTYGSFQLELCYIWKFSASTVLYMEVFSLNCGYIWKFSASTVLYMEVFSFNCVIYWSFWAVGWNHPKKGTHKSLIPVPISRIYAYPPKFDGTRTQVLLLNFALAALAYASFPLWSASSEPFIYGSFQLQLCYIWKFSASTVLYIEVFELLDETIQKRVRINPWYRYRYQGFMRTPQNFKVHVNRISRIG